MEKTIFISTHEDRAYLADGNAFIDVSVAVIATDFGTLQTAVIAVHRFVSYLVLSKKSGVLARQEASNDEQWKKKFHFDFRSLFGEVFYFGNWVVKGWVVMILFCGL
jgi:hypothetical protein